MEVKKVIKNPFIRIQKESVKYNGKLPANIRKRLMEESVKELKQYKDSIEKEQYE